MTLPAPIRLLLWPLSLVYGAAGWLRGRLYAAGILKTKRLPVAVVSVGNLTVGGTGKTPMVLWLAERFLAEGKRVAILSRGYRGSDGSSDEIEVMRARLGDGVVFGVGANRFEQGSKLAAQRAIDVFLLDDGYQHLQLARDVNILLVDATRPLRQEYLLPAGRLREPLSAADRADIIFFTRTGNQAAVKNATQKLPQIPVFPATTKLKGYRLLSSGGLDPAKAGPLPLQPVFAFCGIGNPEAFFADVQSWGNVLVGSKAFPDHHKYDLVDLLEVERVANAASARSILMTAKDAVNLQGHVLASLPAYACEIDLSVADDASAWGLIRTKLAWRAGAAR